jgi:hypothetical protein
MTTRIVKKCFAVVGAISLAVALAAPAQAAKKSKPPTRLWYELRMKYEFTDIHDVLKRGPGEFLDRSVANVVWEVHPADDGAVLVRRNPRSGKFTFSSLRAIDAVGTVTKADWDHEFRWNPAAVFVGCSPSSIKSSSHIQSNPEMVGNVAFSDGALVWSLSAAPHSLLTQDTGPVMCPKEAFCPKTIPGRPTAEQMPDGSCRYDPQDPIVHTTQWEFPWWSSDVPKLIAPQREFQIKRGFGRKHVSASTRADAFVRGELDNADTTETAIERISFEFTLCPGSGRRSC